MERANTSPGRLEGKVAILTGAASGIGRAAVSLFVQEGARVLAVDRQEPPEDEPLFQGSGERLLFLRLDLAESEAPEEMVRHAIQRYGRLDILFNNAGVHGSGSTPMERWDDCLQTNWRALYQACLAAFPHLQAVGGGSIVNTASIAGPVVGFASPHYDASKAAVVGLTRHLASRWGRYGIRVNALCPGFVQTPFIGPAWTEERLQAVTRDIALGRLADPMEIARVALFLASDEASYITGAALVADGGWTIHFVKY